MWNRLWVSILVAMSLAPIAGARPPGAVPDSAENLLLILDASGSMWGRVGEQEKIVVAKEVLTDLVSDLPQHIHVGLEVYGHRREGDCEDIEIVVPIGSGNAGLLQKAMARLQPQGKTPLARSIEVAAEQLRSSAEATTVVLVSDGEDTCGGDPCAAARALIQQGFDFRMHVVGFDLAPEEEQQLLCVAEAGGGQYFSAESADQLHQAIATVRTRVIEETTGGGFRQIELTPQDVGSTSPAVFSTLPTEDPQAFGLSGRDVRRVDFDTLPDGEPVGSNAVLTDQYASLGLRMNGIRVSNRVYEGAASPPNATTSPASGGFAQIFTFEVPVVAAGIINTSPDQDRIEVWSGPRGTGKLLHSFIDQVGRKMNFKVDRFVGGRAAPGDLIGSLVLKNHTGQIELDELIFEVETGQR